MRILIPSENTIHGHFKLPNMALTSSPFSQMLSVNKSDSYREMKALRDLYTVTKPKPVRRRVGSATTEGSRNNNPVKILNVSNNRIPCLERLGN